MTADPQLAPAAAHRPASGSSENSTAVWVRWGLLLGFTLLFGSVSLVYPFGRDQAIFAFVGNAILHGMTLYRDIPVMTLPMVHLVNALSQLLFGRTTVAVRILDLLWTLATTGMLSLLVTKLFRRRWLGVIAGLIYSFTYYSIDFWNTAQVDGFMNLPLVISMYLLARGLTTGSPGPQSSSRRAGASSGLWFVAGILMGTALLFKYTVGLLVPGVALVLLFVKGRPRAENSRVAVLFCCGCLATGFAAFLAMVLSGALPSFIRLQAGTTIPYSQHGRVASVGQALNTLFIWIPPKGLVADTTPYVDVVIPATLLGVLGLVPALAMVLKRRGSPSPVPASRVALILLWLAAAAVSVVAQGKFFQYHYLVCLPPLSVFGALAMAFVFRPLAGRITSPGRRAALVTIALVGVALGTRYPARLVDLARVASGGLNPDALWSRLEFNYPGYSVAENLALTEYLREHTGPSDRISNLDPTDEPFTFPHWRQPVLRLATTTEVDPASWQLPDEFRTSPPNVFTIKRGERIMPFRWTRSRDAYRRLMAFAFKHGEVMHWVLAGSRDGYELLMAFTELRNFAAEHYELEVQLGHYDVLRLADSDSTLPVSACSVRLVQQDLAEALEWLRVRSASPRSSGFDGVRAVLWPIRVPDGLDTVLGTKMLSHKTVNWGMWSEEMKLKELLPALSVWIADDDRPFARLDPFRRQGEGKDYDAGGLSFRVQHRCRNGLVFVYGVRRTPAPPTPRSGAVRPRSRT